MTRLITFVTLGILAALLALGAPAGAFAQGPTGSSKWSGARLGGPEQSLVGMAAAQIEVSRVELLAQLRSGTTLAEALKAGGVDVAAFVDRFIASRAERLDAVVAAGALTRAEADVRLATLRANVTTRLNQPSPSSVPVGRARAPGRAAPGRTLWMPMATGCATICPRGVVRPAEEAGAARVGSLMFTAAGEVFTLTRRLVV